MAELGAKVNIKHPIDPQNVTSHRDPFHPDAYVISVPLDSDPSYVWQRLFEKELGSSLDFWDRKVFVVGRELKLVTTRERLGEKLSWLDDVVTATNKRVEEHNKKAKWSARGQKPSDESISKDLADWMLGRSTGR